MCSKRGVLLGLAIVSLGLLFSVSGLLSAKASATAGVNQEMSFEGKIVNASGINIADATYNMEFKIYTAAGSCNPTTGVGCTLGWTEDWLVSASQGVTTSGGTFEVNLDSIAANNFSGIDFNSYPLYLSIQVGSSTTCTPAGNFTANCGGDGEMKPYILLTSSPYAINSGLLGGLASTAFGQVAANQTFTGTNTFQPTTNITSVKILQNSSGSFGQDVFDVQGSSGGANNFIQITSTAANQGAVTIQSLGANNLNLNSGSNTISVGATSVTGTGALTLAAASGQSLDLESGTTANLNLGISANNKTVNIGAVGSTANTTTLNLATSTGAAETVNVGSTNSGSSVNLTAGATKLTIGNTGATLQATTNSATTFQVQDTAGTDILDIDTTDTNLVTNPGFEVNASSWVAAGTTAPTRDTTNKYLGVGSGAIASVTAAGEGFKQVLATTLANGTYTISWYDKMISGPAFTDVIAAYSATGSAPVNCTSINTQTVSSSGWTRHSCQISVSGASASNYITIFQVGSSTSRTWNIDAVQLESGSIATAFGTGTIMLNSNVTSPLSLKNNEDSTTAFNVQDQTGTNLFNIDTLNNQISLGAASSQSAKLTFYNASNANTASIQAGTTSSSYTWTLPTADAAGCLASNGSGTLSIAACGDTNIQTFSANGTYTLPANSLMVIIEAWGSGGGGAGGTGKSLAQVNSGGGAGGGAAYTTTTLSASTIGVGGTTLPVTVGAGGGGGAGGTTNVGSVGISGNPSCFSTTTGCAGTMFLEAFGGGGGLGSGTAGNGGGGGGGSESVGLVAPSATGGAGGSPLGAAAAAMNSGSGGGGGGTAAATGGAGGSSNYGGGGGGSSSSTGGGNSGAGGGSNQGAAGGGAGGTTAITTCTARNGGAGGHVPGLSAGGGTAGSGAGGAGGAGSAGAGSGGDGGGGGANTCTNGGTGGTGGVGGARGGGGGGGGASGGTGTQVGGTGGTGGAGYLRTWTLRGSGADLAEIYCTNDPNLTSGDTVSIDPSLKAGVQKTQKAYDKNAIGIISTNPGLVTGSIEEQCVKPVLVGLAGRVPVHVSMENGPIQPGDYLTPSSTPGVAMKAIKAGTIIGQALTGYDDSMPNGYVVAFINNGQSNGSSIMDVVAQDTSTDPSQSVEQQALQYLMGWKDKAVDTTDLSEIFTDRVSAGVEIITPSVVADKVAANTITPSSTGNITFDLGQNGNLIIKNKDGGDSFSIDATGNAAFGVKLSVLGDMEIKGGLSVDGDSLFGGNATFAKMAQFLGDTTFTGNVDAQGRITFNSDTGGIAIIKQGASRVDVSFNKEYSQSPIVSASLVSDQVRLSDGTIEDPQLKEQRLFDAGYNYLISNVTTKGFTVVLSKKATEDIQFNWYAIAVKDARTSTSTSDQISAPTITDSNSNVLNVTTTSGP